MHIHIMEAEYWVGLYVDGELVWEDHRIEPITMAELLLPDATVTSSWHDGDDPIAKRASFPKELPDEFSV